MMKRKILWFIIIVIITCISFSSCTSIPDEELAPVESIDILILESFPGQVQAIIDGYLPNPCYEITKIKQNFEENTFYISVIIRENSQSCIQVIKPYKEIVDLAVAGLPAGDYQVNINGVIGSFTLEIDNFLLDTLKR